MTSATDLTRIKQAMLTELDNTLRQNYHQTLTEVLNELRIRNIFTPANPTPDNVFSIVLNNHLLTYKPATSVIQLREALERLAHGKFGLCARCGREIPTAILEKHPTTTLCLSCAQAKR
ncbi:MAG: TraR/DksA C4-type zinc finger protein [Ignavibacteriales bacterium]|nr:TraR/DksA C4-type zinc finger protein [Ignavibacteriales bacterium]